MNDSSPDEETQSLSGGEALPVDAALGEPPKAIGRYRIEKVLGQGGFGLVYLAMDEQLNRRVAIKVPHARLIKREEDAEAYLTEARTVAGLDHPHIVPVYDVGSSPEFPCYIVSKYIEGTDLKARLRQSRLDFVAAAELVATVAEALHYAHKQGLVDRDVKPGNILLDQHDRPYVVDFGLALREADVGKGPRYAGTPAYMSPEQARGEGHRVDGRSDIYSLGAVLYELLTGRRTATAETQHELLEQITSQEVKPPRQIDDRIPRELERICLKALAKRAADRYTTALDMAEDLRLCLSSLPQSTSGNTASATEQTAQEDTTRAAGDSGTARGDSTEENSDSQLIKIVPKGLRSFDAHDADFFLELLPGPRDREGLPDSIRFWKTRVEETDADNTFAVGLIYGPSGCGKSSLVKAGLLPRLSKDVIPVYIEATPEETETRLLHGLRKRCPALEDNLSLKETLAALRRGQGIPVGKKVLIVLDQFEQWLHAKKEEENTDLVQALRQCDGGRVQSVVMVRDDFWMAVTRFLNELEVELTQGQNFAPVDLFPIRHAEKVLASFGRAFGTLPDNIGDTTKEQKEFLKQSVAGLAEEGKVICVRLALFAEMMKGKAWTPATLKEVGGTSGVGVTFLEEIFSSSSASPKHRLHQKAARAVLKDLLPNSGTDIKGYMRSHAELLEASGYGNRPKDFDDLIRILDSEIRLITPTDPEGKDADADSMTQTQAGQKYFQLTHDYLVHSLRDWLTRKQKETRKGRAELKLFDTSVTWNAKPENRFLPSLVDCLNIRLLTDRNKWTEPQRKMMWTAAKVHGLTWGWVLAAVLAIGLSVQYWASQRDWASKQQQTQTAANSLQNNLGPTIPVNIRELQKLPESLVLAELQSRFATDNRRHKLAVALALAAYGRVETDYLISRIDEIGTTDTANFVDALAVDRSRAVAALKTAADQCAAESLWRRKAKLAVAALALGDTAIAADMCQYADRPDPGQRTIFIHEFPRWEWLLSDRMIDLQQLAPLVVDSDHSGLRSGICLAVGSLPVDQLRELNPAGLEAWKQLASRWNAEHADTSTHSATIWLLSQWKISPPEVPDRDQIRPGRDWLVNSAGITMLRIKPPAVEPEPEITLVDPLGSFRKQLGELKDVAKDKLTPAQLQIRATAHFQTGDYAAALVGLEDLLDGAAKLNPGQLPVYRILALSRLGRHEDAAAEFETVHNTLSKQLILYLTVQLAALRGDQTTSLDLLGQASRDETLDDGELYDAACAAALSASFFTETDSDNFQKFKMLSLELLGKSIKAGYSDGQHLSQDPDFKALHAEPAFVALVGKIFQRPGETALPKSEYWLARCEVTRGQFETFIEDTKYEFDKPTDWRGVDTRVSPTADHPAQEVSWYDAVMYCNWLSHQEGKTPAYRKTVKKEEGVNMGGYDQWKLVTDATGYRLPLELEWEYATRAGSQTEWSSGTDEPLLVDYCQMFPSMLAAAVGHKLPNAWGLQDMHGNVWEWCNDLSGGSIRVLRGGGWFYPAANCRTASRSSLAPSLRTSSRGFRLALSSPSGVSRPAEQVQGK